MLAVFLICLIVGGVFVGLSLVSGHGKDFDHGHDGVDGGAHVSHISGHLSHVPHVGDGAHGAHPGGLHSHAGHPAQVYDKTGHAGATESTTGGSNKPRPWLPFLSVRFWTFGAFFFGLTGLALTELSGLAESLATLAAAGVGLGGGLGAATLVHVLRKSVGAPPERDHWAGRTAELILPLVPGGLSKVLVTTERRERELLVALADPARGALPKGTRVVILRLEADGRALVEPEGAIFQREKSVDKFVANVADEIESDAEEEQS